MAFLNLGQELLSEFAELQLKAPPKAFVQRDGGGQERGDGLSYRTRLSESKVFAQSSKRRVPSRSTGPSKPLRTGSEWLILELKEKAEGEDPDVIRDAIRRRVKDAEVLVPASVTTIQGKSIVRYLMDGYAFIKRTRTDDVYKRLVDSTYVEALVCTGDEFSTVGDAEIDCLRSQLRQNDSDNKPNVNVGSKVIVTAGTYEKIEATVERWSLDDDMVRVFIKLRSVQRSISVPRACLRLLERFNTLQTGAPSTESGANNPTSAPVNTNTMISVICMRFREKTQRWALQVKGDSQPTTVY